MTTEELLIATTNVLRDMALEISKKEPLNSLGQKRLKDIDNCRKELCFLLQIFPLEQFNDLTNGE